MNIFEMIKKYDSENQFLILKNSFQQIEFVNENKLSFPNIQSKKIKNILICGLGGSAIGGDVFLNIYGVKLKVPFIVNRNYNIPEFIDENSLVILSSYSGNTEETLSAGKEAIKRNAQIICSTTGGKLEKFAINNNLGLAKLQKGFQPRYAFFMNFFMLVKIIETLGLIPEQGNFLTDSIKLLKNKGENYSHSNSAPILLAEKLIGFVPIIYSVDGKTSGVGLRLKEQFNENSKLHAFCNILPEFNHNEIVGWETFSSNNLAAKVIFIHDIEYYPQIKKRITITTSIIEKMKVEILKLQSNENYFNLRVIDLIYLGDWLSYYLAIMRRKDPSEIDYIHYLKNQLAKNNT